MTHKNIKEKTWQNLTTLTSAFHQQTLSVIIFFKQDNASKVKNRKSTGQLPPTLR
jgi:hypothetical protein